MTTSRDASNGDERQATDRGEKTFRLIEHQSPLRLKPFSRQELWEAVYLGHRQNSNKRPDPSGMFQAAIYATTCQEKPSLAMDTS